MQRFTSRSPRNACIVCSDTIKQGLASIFQYIQHLKAPKHHLLKEGYQTQLRISCRSCVSMVSKFVDIMHDYSQYYGKIVVTSNGLSKVISQASAQLWIGDPVSACQQMYIQGCRHFHFLRFVSAILVCYRLIVSHVSCSCKLLGIMQLCPDLI